MRIVYIAAGAAGMYCGSCLHDNTLAAALIKQGEDIVLVPTYTPIRTDEIDVSDQRVFLGGINVYLQQKSSIFRHTPRLIDSLLDSAPMMKFLSKRRASVDPTKLGDLTVSVLKGHDGNLAKEFHRLIDWIVDEYKPDVVHLSNSMLVSIAGEIRRRSNIPVVCSLSGEDVFLERITEPHYSQARELLRQHGQDATAYVAMNRYYANYMIDYMDLDPAKVFVIPHGLNLDGHGTRPPRNPDEPLTIGYFARICSDKGLHVLAEAFKVLHEDPNVPNVRLRAAGYMASGDKSYLYQIQRFLNDWNLGGKFEYVGEPDRQGKIDVLQSFDVMSVPTVYRESKGLSILEALANAVPVVLPSHGTFPEVIQDTGGGLLFEPENPVALAETLKDLLRQPEALAEYGRRGQQAIHARYNAGTMAEQTLSLYRDICSSAASSTTPSSITADK